MATISGVFQDETTGKPLADVVMDVFPTGDLSGTPITSFQSNDDGTYNITSSYFDTTGCTISVNYPGYGQGIGSPSVFNGVFQLYPSSVTQVVNSVPVWVWVIIGLAAAYLGYRYFVQKKKLF